MSSPSPPLRDTAVRSAQTRGPRHCANSRASCGGRQQPGHPTDRLGDHRTVAAAQTASPVGQHPGWTWPQEIKDCFLLGIKKWGIRVFFSAFIFTCLKLMVYPIQSYLMWIISLRRNYTTIFFIHIFFLISSMQCQKDT